MPDTLFRFRSLKDFELRKEEIVDGMLWLAHPGTTNDPFDACSIIEEGNWKLYDFMKNHFMSEYGKKMDAKEFFTIFNSEQWIDNFLEYLLKNYGTSESYEEERTAAGNMIKGMIEYLSDHANSINKGLYRFACFTETNMNLPMWAHYADNHEGICLEYDISAMKPKRLKNNFFPIFYTDKLPNEFNAPYKKLAFTFYYKILIHKLSDWSYEKEWRFLFDASFWYKDLDAIPDEFWDVGQKIKFMRPIKIYLGYRVNDENTKAMKEIAKKYKIPIARMKITPYGLETEDYNV